MKLKPKKTLDKLKYTEQRQFYIRHSKEENNKKHLRTRMRKKWNNRKNRRLFNFVLVLECYSLWLTRLGRRKTFTKLYKEAGTQNTTTRIYSMSSDLKSLVCTTKHDLPFSIKLLLWDTQRQQNNRKKIKQFMLIKKNQHAHIMDFPK